MWVKLCAIIINYCQLKNAILFTTNLYLEWKHLWIWKLLKKTNLNHSKTWLLVHFNVLIHYCKRKSSQTFDSIGTQSQSWNVEPSWRHWFSLPLFSDMDRVSTDSSRASGWHGGPSYAWVGPWQPRPWGSKFSFGGAPSLSLWRAEWKVQSPSPLKTIQRSCSWLAASPLPDE